MATYADWIDAGWVEPRPWVKQTLGAWGNFLMGEGLTYSPLPAREPIAGQKYDVGATIVPQYTKAWAGSAPNHLTPIELLDLLNFLNGFTDELEGEVGKLFAEYDVSTCAELAAVRPEQGAMCRDVQRWRKRLDEYSMSVGAVPESSQYDRTQTLWTVAAPLFLGWYGGRTGGEIPLVADGFPEGFDPKLRHPPDIGTPYSLANQLGIARAWEKERKFKTLDELAAGGGRTISTGGGTLLVVGGLAFLALMWWIFGTPKALEASRDDNNDEDDEE